MTTATSWRIRGNMLDACSCAHGCPCQFGADPTLGYCEGIMGFHIQEGYHGDTQLDGLNIVLPVRFPGNAMAGGWTLATYLDERANEEQMQALGSILSGQAGGVFAALGALIEKALPPKQVRIDFEIVNGDYRLSVPGLVEAGSEAIPSPMPDQPPLSTTIHDGAHPLFKYPAKVRRSTVCKLTDPDLSFDHSGRSVFLGEFDLKGP